MITEKDLQEAIAECQGKRNPDASTCIKLAAFLTIQKEMFGNPEPVRESFSFAAPPIETGDPVILSNGDSEFLQVIDGRRISDVLPVLDELMMTLQAIQPRLYAGVMRKLE